MTLAIVTGAPGWLGSRLAPDVELVRGDVRKPETLGPLFAGAEDARVFHAAGVVHPGATTRLLFDVNVEGTRNVLSAARRRKRGASSICRPTPPSAPTPPATTPSTRPPPITRTSYHPYMKYGRTEMLAEQLVQAAQVAGDIESVIVRPPWFYGPGQPPRQTLFFRMIHVLGEMNKTIACSIAKAESELGYNPSVDLEEGMRRSIQWLLERGETL